MSQDGRSSTPPAEPAKGNVLVEVRDVVMRFGDVEVLRGVSFDVRRGETLCLLGGSGGGKTTMMNIMIGVLRPTSGSVRSFGEDVAGMSPAEIDRMRRRFGVTFQGGAMLNSMTIGENVALPLEFHTRLDAETIRTIVQIKLQQVGLLHAIDLYPAEVSGGMLKRAAVARALALDPKLLFHDEPSAGLDPIATSRMDALINSLKETMGMTNVVITHVMESVERIADHVVLLDKGRVVLDGDLEALGRSEAPEVVRFRTGDLGGSTSARADTSRYYEDLLF